MEEHSSQDHVSTESIIGQFGVGFYSAFMVADSVVVKTRKEDSDKGYLWKWNGYVWITFQIICILRCCSITRNTL